MLDARHVNLDIEPRLGRGKEKGHMRTAILFSLLLLVGCGGAADRAFAETSANDTGDAGDAQITTGVDRGVLAPVDGAGEVLDAPDAGGAAATTDAGTATTDAGTAPTTCTAGAVRCSGHQPQTCVDGVWLANGSLCPGTLPACLDGVCVACTPGEHSCADGTHPETCDATGAWVPDAVTCTGGQQCSAGTCVTICCGVAICDFGAATCYSSPAGYPSCIGPCQIGATCSFGLVTSCS